MKNLTIFLLIISAIVNAGCFRPYTVEGKSMMPALVDGDHILVDTKPENLARGDIILFNDPIKNEIAVCRILGLSNDKITIEDNKVYVNEQILIEPYVSPENSQLNKRSGTYQVLPDQYFVLGDNRDHSKDSRVYGSISKNTIIGKYYSSLFNLE